MDYAKMALLKAEELEKKAGGTAPTVSRSGMLLERTLKANEKYAFCKLMGNAEAAVIVSLTFESVVIGAEVSFLTGGRVSFTRPMEKAMLFMASVRVDGSLDLGIRVSLAAKILSADVLAIGAAVLGPAGAAVRADSLNGYSGAVYVTDGEIRVSIAEGMPDLSNYALAGFGKSAAIAAIAASISGEVQFGVLFIDDNNELVYTLFSSDMRQLSLNYLKTKADTAALISGNVLTAGYCYAGFAYAGILENNHIERIIRIEEATSVEFVKSASPAAVILEKNGKSIIRIAQSEIPTTDCISIKIECTQQGA